MFKWLAKQFQRGEEDPDSLGSETGLQNFIAGLPVTVAARTVEAIGEPFESAKSLGLPPERLRTALKRLDERAREPLELVWDQLFEDPNGRDIAEGSWLVLSRFHRNLHTGYDVCLQDLRARTQLGEEERSDALLVACRAMSALGRFKTLMRMRYRDVEPAYWDRLHGLAAWASGFGGARTLIELYPRSGYQSSVEREYLVALLYDAAPIGNMLPPQLVGLDILLRRLATHLQFADGYRDSTPFVIDPEREPGVRRFLKGLSARPGQRFFGAGAAYGQLAALHKQARRDTPDWIARARLDFAQYRGLLELLLRHWSPQPPQRRHRRERTEGEILVSRGVGQVRRMIAASEYAQSGGRLTYDDVAPYEHKLFGKMRFGSVAEPTDAATSNDAEASAAALTPLEQLQKFELEGDRQMTERWTMNDESQTGFGAIAPAHGGWARAGMLLGYRRSDNLDWQLAVIRRLGRTAGGKLSIGAENLEGETLCARIRIGSGDAANTWVAVAGSADVFHDAILLRTGTSLRLLVEPGIYTHPQECMLSFERLWHRVRLERSIERGYDFELLEITLLEDAD